MEWVRGEIIGRGSFSTINMATPKRDSKEFPSVMAVKSTLLSHSPMLRKEKQILSHLRNCSQILQCYGDDATVENGLEFYNVFLELACRGTLAQLLKKSGGSMNVSDIRHCTKSILQGLCHIHANGYVHCDIKPQNILVCGDTDIKIADFGLAKKAGEKKNPSNEVVLGLVGTPLYMSPETIAQNQQEALSDVWALGCIVVEMITGKPAWKCQIGADVTSLLFRIGFGEELPEIPQDFCKEGKDFLSNCFVRDPTKRWTAEMLLSHPFMTDDTVPLPKFDKQSPSPRSVFDFPAWTPKKLSLSSSFAGNLDSLDCCSSTFGLSIAPCARVSKLAFEKSVNWSFSEDWITVRETKTSVQC